jgi:hypothetical protein
MAHYASDIAGGIKPDDLKTIGVSFVTPVATVFGVPVSIKPTQKRADADARVCQSNTGISRTVVKIDRIPVRRDRRSRREIRRPGRRRDARSQPPEQTSTSLLGPGIFPAAEVRRAPDQADRWNSKASFALRDRS